MPKVFIPQVTGRFTRNGDSNAPEFQPHDTSDLSRFGEPVVIFKRDLFPDNASELIDDCIIHATNVLREHGEDDYFCLMGSPLYVALCAMILGGLGHSPCKMLRFDKLHGAYYEIDVTLRYMELNL